MSRLAIMCGLPLSGKSTFANGLKLDGWTVICPDDVRIALHGHAFHGPAEPFVWASCELMVRALVLRNHKVLIDATNIAKERRRVWSGIAREHGLKLEAFVMTTSPEKCRRRAAELEKLHMVDVIDRMAANWEPVEEEEGVVVKIAGEEHR